MLLHSRQAAEAACQAAATAEEGVPLLHQPTHGLDPLVHGHQLAKNPHISTPQPPLQENRHVAGTCMRMLTCLSWSLLVRPLLLQYMKQTKSRKKRGSIQSDTERAEESGQNVPDDWR